MVKVAEKILQLLKDENLTAKASIEIISEVNGKITDKIFSVTDERELMNINDLLGD